MEDIDNKFACTTGVNLARYRDRYSGTVFNIGPPFLPHHINGLSPQLQIGTD